MITLNNTNNILHKNANSKTYEIKKVYPVKDFLHTHSYLVYFNEKEVAGKSLNKKEEAKQRRIYELRDRVFSKIKDEIKKYYETLIDGDFRFHGMPEIERGIDGWVEGKIWQLLVRLGEPNHLKYKNEEGEEIFWREA